MPSALHMATDAANACQGATFGVRLKTLWLMRQRCARSVLAALALTAVGATTALGYWTGGGTSPVGTAVAATVDQGETPAVSKSSGNIWVPMHPSACRRSASLIM